jgi:hypothetical protein
VIATLIVIAGLVAAWRVQRRWEARLDADLDALEGRITAIADGLRTLR